MHVSKHLAKLMYFSGKKVYLVFLVYQPQNATVKVKWLRVETLTHVYRFIQLLSIPQSTLKTQRLTLKNNELEKLTLDTGWSRERGYVESIYC